MMLGWNVLGIASFFLLRIQFATNNRFVKNLAILIALLTAVSQVIALVVSTVAMDSTPNTTDRDEWDTVEDISELLTGSTHAILGFIAGILSIIQLATSIIGTCLPSLNLWGKRIVMGVSAQIQVRTNLNFFFES